MKAMKQRQIEKSKTGIINYHHKTITTFFPSELLDELKKQFMNDPVGATTAEKNIKRRLDINTFLQKYQNDYERFFLLAALLVFAVNEGDVEFTREIFSLQGHESTNNNAASTQRIQSKQLEDYIDYSFFIGEPTLDREGGRGTYRFTPHCWDEVDPKIKLASISTPTLLGIAAHWAYTDMIEFLIKEKNADPNAYSFWGHVPLFEMYFPLSWGNSIEFAARPPKAGFLTRRVVERKEEYVGGKCYFNSLKLLLDYGSDFAPKHRRFNQNLQEIQTKSIQLNIKNAVDVDSYPECYGLLREKFLMEIERLYLIKRTTILDKLLVAVKKVDGFPILSINELILDYLYNDPRFLSISREKPKNNAAQKWPLTNAITSVFNGIWEIVRPTTLNQIAKERIKKRILLSMVGASSDTPRQIENTEVNVLQALKKIQSGHIDSEKRLFNINLETLKLERFGNIIRPHKKTENENIKEKLEELVRWRGHWLKMDCGEQEIKKNSNQEFEELFHNAAFLICAVENGDVNLVTAIFAWDDEHNHSILKEYINYSFSIFPAEDLLRFKLFGENKWGWKGEGSIYISYDPNHNPVPMYAQTLLGRAAFFGHAEMVRYLILENKADPNVYSHLGHSAMHEAFYGIGFFRDFSRKNDYLDVVQTLLEFGSDFVPLDKPFNRSLHILQNSMVQAFNDTKIDTWTEEHACVRQEHLLAHIENQYLNLKDQLKSNMNIGFQNIASTTSRIIYDCIFDYLYQNPILPALVPLQKNADTESISTSICQPNQVITHQYILERLKQRTMMKDDNNKAKFNMMQVKS